VPQHVCTACCQSPSYLPYERTIFLLDQVLVRVEMGRLLSDGLLPAGAARPGHTGWQRQRQQFSVEACSQLQLLQRFKGVFMLPTCLG
jgi:hypothetical protein